MKATQIVAAIVLAASTSSVFAKDIVSTKEVVQIAGVRTWVAEARCDGIDEPLTIRRGAGKDQWCSGDYADICDDDRLTLGGLVCEWARSEQAEVVEVETAKAEAVASRPALVQEKMDIEAALIALKQKRIDLQRKELELQRRQISTQ
ncbi:hypothetical protein [Arenicella xantha]|nr:hypothetical protein [Arenicella xantha]